MMIVLFHSQATCYLAQEVMHLHILHYSFQQKQNMYQANRHFPDVSRNLKVTYKFSNHFQRTGSKLGGGGVQVTDPTASVVVVVLDDDMLSVQKKETSKVNFFLTTSKVKVCMLHKQ